MIIDFYETPLELCEAIFTNELGDASLAGATILDAGAGRGNITQMAVQFGYKVIAVEQSLVLASQIKRSLGVTVAVDDYLKWKPDHKKNPYIDAVVMNPPFSLALEFVSRSVELFPNAPVIALLRLAFLETKKRYPWLSEHPVRRLYALSERPSFTENGTTDNAAYGWFVWSNSGPGFIKTISWKKTQKGKKVG